jgi:hypothetical protein
MIGIGRGEVKIALYQFEEILHVISTPCAVIECFSQAVQKLTEAGDIIFHRVMNLKISGSFYAFTKIWEHTVHPPIAAARGYLQKITLESFDHLGRDARSPYVVPLDGEIRWEFTNSIV